MNFSQHETLSLSEIDWIVPSQRGRDFIGDLSTSLAYPLDRFVDLNPDGDSDR